MFRFINPIKNIPMKPIFFAFLLISFNGLAQQKIITLYFEHASWKLNPEEGQKMNVLNAKDSNLVVDSILAFTNELGSESYNQSLAYHRLQSVKEYLKANKVPFDLTKVHGENYPKGLNPKDDDPSWRKVEIYLHAIRQEVEIVEQAVEINSQNTDFRKIFEEQKMKGVFEPIQLKIEFHSGTIIVKNYSYKELENLFWFLKNNESINIYLKGHVCCGPNFPLSYGRALEISNQLNKAGIDKNRIKIDGFSNTQPLINPEITEEDQQRNRRVEVVFSIKE
jgi:outer membrane protein OmpA-like peptidoglycan-associated protein